MAIINYYNKASSRTVRVARCFFLVWNLFWVLVRPSCDATTPSDTSSRSDPTPHNQLASVLGEPHRHSSSAASSLRIPPDHDNRVIKDELESDDDAFVFVASKNMPPEDFCKGMYMTMFMDGFHWSLLFRPSPQCLNYFVQSWRLENASKFRGAMLFTFLLTLV